MDGRSPCLSSKKGSAHAADEAQGESETVSCPAEALDQSAPDLEATASQLQPASVEEVSHRGLTGEDEAGGGQAQAEQEGPASDEAEGAETVIFP
jgi:hypothetical protein